MIITLSIADLNISFFSIQPPYFLRCPWSAQLAPASSEQLPEYITQVWNWSIHMVNKTSKDNHFAPITFVRNIFNSFWCPHCKPLKCRAGKPQWILTWENDSKQENKNYYCKWISCRQLDDSKAGNLWTLNAPTFWKSVVHDLESIR